MQRDPEQLTDIVMSPARNTTRLRRFGFWLCSCFVFLCVPLYGIDPGRSLDQLDHTGWTYIAGSPGEVNALAQTTDGYLWLGTATGLFRFDGVRFHPYKPQSGQTFLQRNVVSLFDHNFRSHESLREIPGFNLLGLRATRKDSYENRSNRR
jgi:hypothetical protein